MLRPRTLIISPLLTITGVTAVLVGAALYLGAQEPATAPVVLPEHEFIQQEMHLGDLDLLTAEEVPRFFEGHFIWDGQTMDQQQVVGMDVHDVNEVDGLLVATGRGTYNTNYRDIDFTFRIETNPRTGEFTMWESEPNVASGFVTQGRHEARLDGSFDTVHARWVGDDGDSGTLVLRAATSSTRTGSLDQELVADETID